MKYKKLILYIPFLVLLILTWTVFFSCESKKESTTQVQGSDIDGEGSAQLPWTQMFLEDGYTQYINYESYEDANDFPDETNHRILWEGVDYDLLGAISEISSVYMTSIDIHIKSNGKTYNFPRDVKIVKSVVRGSNREISSVEDFIGEGYTAQIFPNGLGGDFTGDNINDVFFGLQQSGTTSNSSYYLLTYNSETSTFECIGYNIGYEWVDDEYVEDRIPVGYAYNPVTYLIYPMQGKESNTFFLRQAYPLFSKKGEDEYYSIVDGVKGVFVIDWAYTESQWVIIAKDVKLQGRLN